LRHIPALVLTSSSLPEDRRKSMDYGASGYFAKSEDYSDVLVALSTCLAGGCVPGLQMIAAQCA
jgi:DNA-binding NarL/FixJ family response regulator